MRNMTQIDFSQNAIKNEVTSRILQHPISIYAILFGGVGLFFWLINLFGGVILFVAIGVLAVGAISFIVNYFRKDSIQMKYVTLLNTQMQQHKERLVTRLKQKLEKFREAQRLSLYSTQAEEQYEKVREKFDTFTDILQSKLDPTEIAFQRFLGTVEQLYLAILDNLEKVVLTLEGMHTTKLDYIEKRLRHLHALDNPEQADLDEIETLNKRKESWETRREKVNKLLTHNEQAMTEIDLAMSGITEAETKAGRASVDMEYARDELDRLIERIKQ